MGYLKKTDYNTTIPKGVKGVQTAHKVGMIPASRIYNDVGIVYDKNPFALAVMTNNLSYNKSQKVIAEISKIVYKHHKEKNKVNYVKTKKNTNVYLLPVVTTKANSGILAKGEVFKVSAEKGEWYEIHYGGKKGHIRKKEVTSYTKPPIGGFVKGTLKNNGLVSAKGNSKILNKPASNGKVILTLKKGSSLNIHSLSGEYYKTLVGNRLGYIHKDAVQLQYTSAVKYIEIMQEDTWLYSLRDGIYVHIGSLKKGQIFIRTKDAGAFSEVQIGNAKAFVQKTTTNPLFTATIQNPVTNQTIAGEITFNSPQYVYSKPSSSPEDIIGTLNDSQKISYSKVVDSWYEINFLGRKAYVQIINNK